jgi:ABC-type sugar transport system permease subunit
MAPTIVLAMMLRMIDAFRIFDPIYVTTGEDRATRPTV